MKRVKFHGDARAQLRGFPADVCDDLGHNLREIQKGLEPADWKPMAAIGPGVREIRSRNRDGTWRVIYLATLPDAVHVFHAFQKKTEKTLKRDIEIARDRYRAHMRSLER